MRITLARSALSAANSFRVHASRLLIAAVAALGLAGAALATLTGEGRWLVATSLVFIAIALLTAGVAARAAWTASDQSARRAWAPIGLAFGAVALAELIGLLLRLGHGRANATVLAMLPYPLMLGAVLLTLLLVQRQVRVLQESVRHTEQRVAAEARARAEAEAASQAKSAFLATMSHELRTPLTAILGYSELLQFQAEQRSLPEFSADLREIENAGQQLLSMVNDVLDLARVEAGTLAVSPQRFDLPAFVADIGATAGAIAAARGNQLQIACPPDLGEVALDPLRLRQVIVHLLRNAGKFTENGTIELRVARREARAGAPAPGPQITLEVHDSGIGMTPEQLERLFQPFAQAHGGLARPYDGSGLGLALSQRLCVLMGGRIEASSAPGAGSTFTITLPVEMPQADWEG